MRLYILFVLDTAFGWQSLLSPEQLKKAGILPWIGVLKVRSGNTEFATILTLIAERLAAGIANDISKLDRETLRISTKAIFFNHNVPWYCDVTDYKIHPEFNNMNLSNTLAILHLDCDRQIWTPINWPIHPFMPQIKPNSLARRNIYAIGLNDRNYDFEQIIFRMKFVNSRKCVDFYVREEINFEHLWPKYFFCLKAVDIKRQCVFDSGMALATLNNGTWTLIGISVLGPGCVLPSRYIDIFPYVPWMKKEKNTHMLSYRRQLKDDSTKDSSSKDDSKKGDGNKDDSKKDDSKKDKENSTVTAIDPSKDIVSDTSLIEDTFNIEKLNDSTMVLRPKYANVRDNVYGDCANSRAVIMYRDADLVRTSTGAATGIFTISLYDLFYYEITCVMVSVRCDKRSLAKFWYESGFKADSLDDIIKIVPHYKRGEGIPPKILFLTDTFFNYEHIRTANLVFKFEFTGEAAINVDFYGVLVTTTRRTRRTTTTTIRPRRTHPYHLSYTPAFEYENYVNGPPNNRKMLRTRKRIGKKPTFRREWN